ncbi:MAG: Zn-dependent protease with chaperone function [Ponticaulis sp.]|nr:Zn-dependent protease with chaperone function [Ponticaulis sp.]
MTFMETTRTATSSEAAREFKPRRKGVLASLVAGTSLALMAACTSTNPYTGEEQLALYDEAQLAEASAQAWAELKASTPTIESGAQYQRVMRVWNRVAAATPKAGEAWEVAVFDSEEVNAFVMPGNRVGVYRGLLELVENDDQLAAVLGHEVAHAIYRHANQRASRAAIASGAAQVGGAVISGGTDGAVSAEQVAALGSVAGNLGVVLPYSRSAELEADLAGVDYMHAAGFDAQQAVRLWQLMEANGGARTAAFLSTHPDPATRRQRIQDYINSKGY